MNMGEVKDPNFMNYSVHYSSPEDARCRHESFTLLKERSGLTRVIEPNNEEDINHMLARYNSPLESVYLHHLPEALGTDGKRLSDSTALSSVICLQCSTNILEEV
jgi:hypothetical protein